MIGHRQVEHIKTGSVIRMVGKKQRDGRAIYDILIPNKMEKFLSLILAITRSNLTMIVVSLLKLNFV